MMRSLNPRFVAPRNARTSYKSFPVLEQKDLAPNFFATTSNIPSLNEMAFPGPNRRFYSNGKSPQHQPSSKKAWLMPFQYTSAPLRQTKFERAKSKTIHTTASIPTFSTSFKSGAMLFGLAGIGLGFLLLNSEDKAEAKEASLDYNKVRKDIANLLESDPKYDDGSFAPILVRLAWHAAGTYDNVTKTGGSNGAGMRYEREGGDGANRGLATARDLLEPIKKKYPQISYADLWTLASIVAIKEIGGPEIKWRPGRSDFANDTKCAPRGRLPDASLGADHIRAVFYRMDFNDQEIVALVGAHVLGRCHQNRSGYDGPWTKSPTMFSNDFFRELVENKWEKRKWSGPEQYTDPSGELMMLPSDIALLKDPQFSKYVKAYANDEELFFKDFAKAYEKLMELGVPFK